MQRLIYAALLICFFGAPYAATAGDVTVRPFLIDETLEPRQSITRTITLSNSSEFTKKTVYATVNEITVDNTGEIREFVSPVQTDRANTVTSWLEITRGGIELMPGETKDVPLTIHINHNAIPGEYHVFVGLTAAAKRFQAERLALAGEADGVIVKVTVADTAVESLRVKRFSVNRIVTGRDDNAVELELLNEGDVPVTPSGELIFYTARGEEVVASVVNESGATIAPGETKVLPATIPIENKFGRFKANLALTYGADQTASLSDTAFFYVLPWQYLVGIAAVLFFVLLALSVGLRRAYNSDAPVAGDEVPVYVRDGSDATPVEHDLHLHKKTTPRKNKTTPTKKPKKSYAKRKTTTKK